MTALDVPGVRRALALSLLAAACGGDETATSDPRNESALVPGCEAALEAPLRAWERSGFSGAVAVVQAGRARCLLGLGLADRAAEAANTPDTVFSIGSVSKTFTAAAALEQVGAGSLELDEPVSRWLEPWPADKRAITLRQLLVHTSGLGSDHGADHVPLARADALAAIARQPLLFEPGTGYEYSNSGYTLLALLLETAAGQPFRTVLTERVNTLPGARTIGGFWDGQPAPIGARAVGYGDDGEPGYAGRAGEDHWALDGNGSLAMSVEELASWALALSRGAILAPAELELMLTPMVDLDDGFGEAPGWVSVAPEVLGAAAFASAGGGGDVGHNAVLFWSPEADLIVALMSNAATVDAEDLLQPLLPVLLAGEPFPTPLEPVRLPAEALIPVVGTYRLEAGGELVVAADGEGISVTAVGGRAVGVLFPILDGVEPEAVEEHERAAVQFLAGASAEARAEIARLEARLGVLSGVEIEATVLESGELRTFLTLRFEQRTLLAWLALGERGTLMAIELDTDWPTLHLIAVSEQLVFAPRGALASEPHVEVRSEGGGARLRVVGEEEALAVREAAP